MHCFSVRNVYYTGVSTSLPFTHRPRGPKNPVAWHSSIKISAPYCSARSHIPTRGATSPSIENTPSVTTSLRRQDCVWRIWHILLGIQQLFEICNNNYLEKGINICITGFLHLVNVSCSLQLCSEFKGNVVALMPNAIQTKFSLDNNAYVSNSRLAGQMRELKRSDYHIINESKGCIDH